MVSVVRTAAVDLANPTGSAAAVEVLDQVGGAKIAAAVVLVNAAGEIATLELGATSLAALGNVTVGGTVDLAATSLAALENITVGGSVELGSVSLSALESITAELGATSLAALEDITVGGSVELGSASLAALEDITVGGTVELGTASLNALESVTAELGAASLAALESITVGGTVELGATSLAALESITVADVATEATLSGINNNMGADGDTPPSPAVNASGVRGWLRGIFDKATALLIGLNLIAETVQASNSVFTDGDKGLFVLAKRRDADTTLVADGDYAGLNMDETGRLKVATQPGSIAAVTGNIAANGQTVVIDVSRASTLTISMVATSLVGHNASFEYSNNSTNGTDGNWYGVQVVRSNANTVETATGVLAATPVYGWEASVNAYKWFRIRATAHTSGSAAYILQPGSYATEPIPAGQVTGTQPVSGTITATVGAATLSIPGIVADVASAALTTTTTTAAITPTAGTAYSVEIPVTAATGTNPTLDVVVQESDDTGTNWFDVYHFPRIIATGAYRSPPLTLQGNRIRYVQTVGGTSPSFTRAINRLQRQDTREVFRQLIDRAISLITLNARTTILNVAGSRHAKLVINIGAATTPPQLQLEGSDDNGATWYPIGAPLAAVANSTVALTVPDIGAQMLSARVSTVGVGVTSGYVLLRGF